MFARGEQLVNDMMLCPNRKLNSNGYHLLQKVYMFDNTIKGKLQPKPLDLLMFLESTPMEQ